MKIKRLLIANRGEIAVRIISTAREMKIETVVVRNANEPDAMYVSLADIVFDNTEDPEEIPVFLNIGRLIEIAIETKCDAVHPGYGFLAENAYFAQKCIENKIIFIGPSPDAIYKMGNKTIARELAMKQGIPMATGSRGNIGNEEEAAAAAELIGYPVIIKAASGGGGRGMRIVRKPEELEKMFLIASKEAEKAFNDPSVFIEKYIENPKHIEFQILGDTKGNIVHLGERECSIQRKHQKLLEEAPSSALDDDLRELMGSMAVRMARAVGYYSAGTVEFLLDSDRNFYFMEMNTRLQVEHPVTEYVTGIDLVKEQLRVAAGEKLSFTQEDIKLTGHAIECRINAEDPDNNFMPSPGKIETWQMPGGPRVRLDSHGYAGYVIPPFYDSMLAKLIVHGKNRLDAIAIMLRALREMQIGPVKCTASLHEKILNNPKFRQGVITTKFIESAFGAGKQDGAEREKSSED